MTQTYEPDIVTAVEAEYPPCQLASDRLSAVAMRETTSSADFIPLEGSQSWQIGCAVQRFDEHLKLNGRIVPFAELGTAGAVRSPWTDSQA